LGGLILEERTTRRSILLAHLAQLSSVAVFSCGFMVQQALAIDTPPTTVLLWQFLGAAVIMWAICVASNQVPPLNRRLGKTLLWGLMAPGAVLALSINGGARTDGVSLALMWGLLPLMASALGYLILRENAHWSLAVGSCVGFGGLVIVTLSREAAGEGDLIGNVLVFLAVLCASFSQIIGRRMNSGAVPWFQVATLQVTGALIAVVGLALVTGTLTFITLGSPIRIFAMVYLIVAMTVLNYAVFNFALRHLQVAWVSIYVALNPVLGSVAAIIILGDIPRLFDWVGMTVIIAGVMLPHAYSLYRRRYR
jgi:drug/metabolite transporter (DMT)-like permease